jgi:hypothetical protein
VAIRLTARTFVVEVLVWMIIHRFLSVSSLDFVISGSSANAKQTVVV